MFDIDILYNFIFISLRVGAVFLTFPFFNNRRFPTQIKVAFMLLVTYFMVNVVPFEQPFLKTGDIIPLLFNEIIIGILIGQVGGIIFYAANIAGHLIDNATGLMMAQMYDPNTESSTTMYENIYTMLLSLVFVLLNGPYFVFKALITSYETIPSLITASNSQIVQFFIEVVTNTFVVGLQLAVPIVLITLLSDVILGIIARTIPQIQIYIIGAPIKLILSFLMFIILTEPLIKALTNVVEMIVVEVNKLINFL